MNKIIMASRPSAESLSCIEGALKSVGFVCEVRHHVIAVGVDCYTLEVHTELNSFEEVAVEAIIRVDSSVDSDGDELDSDGILVTEFSAAIPWIAIVKTSSKASGRLAEDLNSVAQALDAAEPRILSSVGSGYIAVPASQMVLALRVLQSGRERTG